MNSREVLRKMKCLIDLALENDVVDEELISELEELVETLYKVWLEEERKAVSKILDLIHPRSIPKR